MPLPSASPPIKRELVREEVYARLKRWIIDGVLEPGEKLRDQDLAATLGTSRTPVREALLRLEDEGFVETAVNRWTRVSGIDVEEARRLYPIIWTLEPLALSLAAPHLTADDFQSMDEATALLEQALEKNDPVAASQADYDFHGVYIGRCDNPELIRILDDLKAKLHRLEVAYFKGRLVADRSVVEHQEIMTALRDRDDRAAAERVRANWRESLQRVMADRDAAG